MGKKFSEVSPPLSEYIQRERDIAAIAARTALADIQTRIAQTFTDEEVPFIITTDGRRWLSSRQLVEDPALADFVRRFAHCFEYHAQANLYLYIGAPPDASNAG